MSNQYKIREVKILLASGAEIVAEVDSVKGIAALLADLANEDLEAVPPAVLPNRDVSRAPPPPTADTPQQRIETKADLAAGVLGRKKIVAFKDNIPQLLRPNAFAATTDAALILVFSYETGLRKTSIEYDAFKGLYESQNIKSGSPLRIILSNLRNAGYLDKSKYSTDKSVSLTAKGETKAVEILKELCT